MRKHPVSLNRTEKLLPGPIVTEVGGASGPASEYRSSRQRDYLSEGPKLWSWLVPALSRTKSS